MTTLSDEKLREVYAQILARSSDYPPGSPSPEQILSLVQREGPEDERLRILDQVMRSEACRRDFDLLRAVARSTERSSESRASAPLTGSSSRQEPNGRDVGVIPLDRARSAHTTLRTPFWRRAPWMTGISAIAAAAVLAVGISQWRSAKGPEVTRAGNGETAVQLIAPGQNEDVTIPPNEALYFTWTSSPGALRYTLEILHDTGEVVFTTTTTDTTVAVPVSEAKLVVGKEHRWWVQAIAPSGEARHSEMRVFRVR